VISAIFMSIGGAVVGTHALPSGYMT